MTARAAALCRQGAGWYWPEFKTQHNWFKMSIVSGWLIFHLYYHSIFSLVRGFFSVKWTAFLEVKMFCGQKCCSMSCSSCMWFFWQKETSSALTHAGAHLDLSAFSSWEVRFQCSAVTATFWTGGSSVIWVFCVILVLCFHPCLCAFWVKLWWCWWCNFSHWGM